MVKTLSNLHIFTPQNQCTYFRSEGVHYRPELLALLASPASGELRAERCLRSEGVLRSTV